MKILNSKQIYAADKATIKSEGITSFELMQRASTVCFNWIDKRLQDKKELEIKVFCGVGNNGGDGLVLSALLHQNGYIVKCYVVDFSNNRSDDFIHAYSYAKDLGCWPSVINDSSQIPKVNSTDVVIDCIFGIGLKREITGFTAKLIQRINQSKAFVLSIDVPSGLYIDAPNNYNDAIIEATHTLTFEVPKWCFLLPFNEKYTESWEVISIGLSESYISSIDADEVVVENYIKSLIKKRSPFSHKGTYGHSLIIGGSYGKIGAIVLSSKAAIKTGSGLVSVLIPKCGYEIVQISNPEIMVQTSGSEYIEEFNFELAPSAIGVGPGLGTNKKTIKGFNAFLKTNKRPLVIDADGLNILATNEAFLRLLPQESILTPHPKEFSRLVGSWNNDFEKLDKLRAFAANNKLILVLKGVYTIITNGEKLYVNSTGNPALATAGSGDVLTGMITSFLTQGYSPLKAAITAVYMHGLSADLGLESESKESFIASDIIFNLGKAFKKIQV